MENPSTALRKALVDSFVRAANRFSTALVIAMLDRPWTPNPPHRQPRPALQRQAKRRALRK